MAEEQLAVTHEVVAVPSAHATETAAAAETAVVAAETAVALAHETAAAAELQAAETVAEVERDADEWRDQVGTSLAMMSETVGSLSSREDERNATLIALSERLERLEASQNRLDAIEASLASLTPPASQTEAVTEAEPDPTLVTAGAVSELGSGEISSAVPTAAEPEKILAAESEPPRRKRRWI